MATPLATRRALVPLLLACAVFAVVPLVAANRVRHKAGVEATLDGVAVQNVLFGCDGTDGKTVSDSDSVTLTTTNGAVMPVGIVCEPPVVVYDLKAAGSVPQRVMASTIPLCTLQPETDTDVVEASASRRLRIATAIRHVSEVGSVADSVFRDFDPEDWDHFTAGRRRLSDLGVERGEEIAFWRTAHQTHHFHRIANQSAPLLARLHSFDYLLHSDHALFPQFMRDSSGRVTDAARAAVELGVSPTATAADVAVDLHNRRGLFIAGVVTKLFQSLVAGLKLTLLSDVYERLNNIDVALSNQRDINAQMGGFLNESSALAQSAYDAAAANAALARDQKNASDALLLEVRANTEQIKNNTADIINARVAAGTRMLAAENRADRAAKSLIHLAGNTSASFAKMEGGTADTQQLINDLDAWANSEVKAINAVIIDLSANALQVSKDILEDIEGVHRKVQVLSRLVWQKETRVQTKNALSEMYHATAGVLVDNGWKPFLWQDTGEPGDADRTGSPPNSAEWSEGNPARRLEIDTVTSVYMERGFEDAGANEARRLMKERKYTFVCDATQVMDKLPPWAKTEDIALLVGPPGCIPLPRPGTAANPPDAADGEWLHQTNGSPKLSPITGKPLRSCVCWIEVTARQCNHGTTGVDVNPLAHPDVTAGAHLPTGDLSSDSLCIGGGSTAPTATGALDDLFASPALSGGVTAFHFDDLLVSGSDALKDWFTADVAYLQDWLSWVATQEYDCGHERFAGNEANPLSALYPRLKFFDDRSPYAIVSSARLTAKYAQGATGGPGFAVDITSTANAGQCNMANEPGKLCSPGNGRDVCDSCHQCDADAGAMRLPGNVGSLASTITNLLTQSWSSAARNLRVLEASRHGVLPNDVWMHRDEFLYDSAASTTYSCDYVTWIQTLGEPEPLQTIIPSHIAKRVTVTINPWGNNADQSDRIKGTDGLDGRGTVWADELSDPSLFNDLNFILPYRMVLAGDKNCLWNECPRPKVFLGADGVTITAVPNERYTYNVPVADISVAPAAASRIGKIGYIRDTASPADLPDGLSLNRWSAQNGGERFSPSDASASLHAYYAPLIQSPTDPSDIQCLETQSAAAGSWCNVLKNYRIYMPTADDTYGAAENLTAICEDPAKLCLIPKEWKYDWQSTLPKGIVQAGLETVCPTIDTRDLAKGFRSAYLTHSGSRSATIRLHITGCQNDVREMDLPPFVFTPVDLDSCGQVKIFTKYRDANTGAWVECGNNVTATVDETMGPTGDSQTVVYNQFYPKESVYNYITDPAPLGEFKLRVARKESQTNALLLALTEQFMSATDYHALQAAVGDVFDDQSYLDIVSSVQADVNRSTAAEAALIETEREAIRSLVERQSAFELAAAERQANTDELRQVRDEALALFLDANAAYLEQNTAFTAKTSTIEADVRAANSNIEGLIAENQRLDQELRDAANFTFSFGDLVPGGSLSDIGSTLLMIIIVIIAILICVCCICFRIKQQQNDMMYNAVGTGVGMMLGSDSNGTREDFAVGVSMTAENEGLLGPGSAPGPSRGTLADLSRRSRLAELARRVNAGAAVGSPPPTAPM